MENVQNILFRSNNMLMFTVHVQLGLGWDVFQNGWDGYQPLRRFEAVPNSWDPSQQIQGL